MTDLEKFVNLFKSVNIPFTIWADEQYTYLVVGLGLDLSAAVSYEIHEGDSSKITGYGGFFTEIQFQDDKLKTIGAWE